MRTPLKIANLQQKGGVAKTTTTISLAACACEKIAGAQPLRVWVIDLDPQGNLTKSIREQPLGDRPTTYELLTGEATAAEVLIPSDIPGLQLIPADIRLANFERVMAGDPGVAGRLKAGLAAAAGEWDLIVMDCGPSLGALTINAMTAADHIIVPIQSSYLCLQGTDDLLETYKLVKSKLNPRLNLLGVLITMHDERTKLGKDVVEQVREVFGKKVFETIIHRNIKLEESPAFCQSILDYAPKSRAAAEYRALYEEVTQWLKS